MTTGSPGYDTRTPRVHEFPLRPVKEPPSQEASREAQQTRRRFEPEALQGLYTVTVGLSLTIGVERLFPGELHGTLEAGAVSTFIAFLATLLPFYHGALRHLDQTYIHLGDGRPPPRWLLFVDFLTLFLEACLLISMGATVEQPGTFLVLLLILLLLDIIWLQIPRFAGSAVDDKPEWGWTVVNLPALAVGVLLFVAAGRSALVSSDVLPFLVALFAMMRTIFDYFWNWKWYFPEPDHLSGSSAAGSIRPQ